AVLAAHVLPGRHAPLEVLADVVEVQVDRRPAPPGHPVLGGCLEYELHGGPVERVATHEFLEQLVDVVDHVTKRRGSRARGASRARASVGAERIARRGGSPARARVRSLLVRPLARCERRHDGIPAGKGPRMPNYLSPGVYVEEVEA